MVSGWRGADPGVLPRGAQEDWIAAAGKEIAIPELVDAITAGVSEMAAEAWWSLTGVVTRKCAEGQDQPVWRAWATASFIAVWTASTSIPSTEAAGMLYAAASFGISVESDSFNGTPMP